MKMKRYENLEMSIRYRNESIRRYVKRIKERYYFRIQASMVYEVVALIHYVSPSTVFKAMAVPPDEEASEWDMLVHEDVITFFVGF